MIRGEGGRTYKRRSSIASKIDDEGLQRGRVVGANPLKHVRSYTTMIHVVLFGTVLCDCVLV